MASADAFALQTEPGPIQLQAPAVSAVHPATIATRAALINCDGRITDLLDDFVCHSLDTADADLAVSDDREWSLSFHHARTSHKTLQCSCCYMPFTTGYPKTLARVVPCVPCKPSLGAAFRIH